MTEDMKDQDATRYLVVSMVPDHFTVVEITDNEGDAKTAAQQQAADNDGITFGVFQKTGSAVLEHKVSWKGARG